jgi:putative acetyltransferase
MKLRLFNPSDLEQILKLFYDTVHSVGAKYYNQQQIHAWAPEHQDKQKWLTKLSNNISYVVELDGIIVGFADMTNTGYIDHIYTHKDYQGRGIALALLNKLEDDARALGIHELTTEASIIAKPLAQRRGYKVIKEQRVVRHGIEIVNYLMSKTLQ